MSSQTRTFALIALMISPCLMHSQIPNGNIFRRVSRVSNFEFSVYNCGTVWGNFYPGPGPSPYGEPLAHWPRNSFHLDGGGLGGFAFLAKKGNRHLVSDANFRWIRLEHGPFDQMVPGRIGDRKAGVDTVFRGPGWRYVDDPDYIVYSSLDYDTSGVDISGANFNDWPIRQVNGRSQYVADPLERSRYKPVYKSDEDLFCVFKDTDTRADLLYSGLDGLSIPIGIEVRWHVYTWGAGPGKDIVVFSYDILNQSGTQLDSCHTLFSSSIIYSGKNVGDAFELSRRIEAFAGVPPRPLAYLYPTKPSEWADEWSATAKPPTIGFSLLSTPTGYSGTSSGLARVSTYERAFYVMEPPGSKDRNNARYIFDKGDSLQYRALVDSTLQVPLDATPHLDFDYLNGPVMLSGPFGMAPGDTAHFSVAIIFADDLPHLLLMDDYITRMSNLDFRGPSPPPTPQLVAKELNRAVKLSWDARAESAADPIIPDSLGEPFRGYRLLRAVTQQGPYVEIGRWVKDSTLVHEYLDRGADLPTDASGVGGLKNNVRYYYRLLSFDAGAPRLKLEPMESPPVDGVNSVSVIPQVVSSNVGTQASDGANAGGTLGDISAVRLIPRETTNFVQLLSGKSLQVRIDATTDGIRYLLPVTVRDTVGGRTHTALLDPGLMVHGSPSIAGIKEGTLTAGDIFSIDAADVTLHYRFEQLNEPYHIVPTLVGQADVPVIVGDSLGVSGILQVTPQTSGARELKIEFSSGGVDTISVIANRYANYLNVSVRDMGTGSLLTPGVDYTFKAIGIRRTGGLISSLKQNRYYLSGQISNGELWDFGHKLEVYNSMVALDFADHGAGCGKPSPYFTWGSSHRVGTRDFQPGDAVDVKWQGGVRVNFPEGAILTLTGAPGTNQEVTQEMLDHIRVVPNPYMVRHEAERGDRRLYFNYLPDECEIRIYTVALDLVKTIHHTGGSREEWDLRTEGGTLIASQVLLAHIETPNGRKIVKKFSVIVGK